MGKLLTDLQVAAFERDGFVFPVDVLDADEVADITARMARVEDSAPTAFEDMGRNNAHLAYDFFDELVHHPKVLDAVEDLIGPDILAMSSVIFAKGPQSPGYVSWHQDGRYMGLSDDTPVTAWIALTESTIENGCMRMAPGTHKGDFLPHEDTFAEDNVLTRGQNIVGIDESTAQYITLKPGQMSLHHWKVAHASGPNRTDARRIGFAIQSYIKPSVWQLEGRGFVQLARGADNHGNSEILPRVGDLSTADAFALRDRINDMWSEQLYDGAEKRRAF